MKTSSKNSKKRRAPEQCLPEGQASQEQSILESLFGEILEMRKQIVQLQENQASFATLENLNEAVKNKPNDEDVASIVAEVVSQKIMEVTDAVEALMEKNPKMETINKMFEEEQNALNEKLVSFAQNDQVLAESLDEIKLKLENEILDLKNQVLGSGSEQLSQLKEVDEKIKDVKEGVSKSIEDLQERLKKSEKMSRKSQREDTLKKANRFEELKETLMQKLKKVKKALRGMREKADRSDVERLTLIIDKMQKNSVKSAEKFKKSEEDGRKEIEKVEKKFGELSESLSRKFEHVYEIALGGKSQTEEIVEKYQGDLRASLALTTQEELEKVAKKMEETMGLRCLGRDELPDLLNKVVEGLFAEQRIPEKGLVSKWIQESMLAFKGDTKVLMRDIEMIQEQVLKLTENAQNNQLRIDRVEGVLVRNSRATPSRTGGKPMAREPKTGDIQSPSATKGLKYPGASTASTRGQGSPDAQFANGFREELDQKVSVEEFNQNIENVYKEIGDFSTKLKEQAGITTEMAEQLAQKPSTLSLFQFA